MSTETVHITGGTEMPSTTFFLLILTSKNSYNILASKTEIATRTGELLYEILLCGGGVLWCWYDICINYRIKSHMEGFVSNVLLLSRKAV